MHIHTIGYVNGVSNHLGQATHVRFKFIEAALFLIRLFYFPIATNMEVINTHLHIFYEYVYYLFIV